MAYSDHFKKMVNLLIAMFECEYLGKGRIKSPYTQYKRGDYKSEFYRELVRKRS